MTTPTDDTPKGELILYQTEHGRTRIIESSHQLPGDGTLDGANVELFTGNDQGRRGFIPHAGDAT